MKKIFTRICAMLLTVSAAVSLCACKISRDKIYTDSDADYVTQKWIACDMVFEAAKEYCAEDALYNIDFTAVLTSPSGTEYVMPGFWNGGSEWIIRFAPT